MASLRGAGAGRLCAAAGRWRVGHGAAAALHLSAHQLAVGGRQVHGPTNGCRCAWAERGNDVLAAAAAASWRARAPGQTLASGCRGRGPRAWLWAGAVAGSGGGVVSSEPRAHTGAGRRQARPLSTSAAAGARGCHYTTLGVKPTATAAEVKDAYRSKARELHPDKMHGASAEDKDEGHHRFVEINAAFAVLGTEASRRKYDMSRVGPVGMQANARGYAGTYAPGGSPATPHAGRDEFDEYGFFRGTHDDARESPYKKVSDTAILLLAVAWMACGLLWHWWRFETAHEEVTELVETRNREAARFLSTAKRRAQENGPQLQLAMLRDQAATAGVKPATGVVGRD